MPNKKLYFSIFFASAVCEALVLCGFVFYKKNSAALDLGLLLGTAVMAGTLWLFFKAWRAAPNGGMVALWYALRIGLTVAAVGGTLLFSGTMALGVIVPQLFPIPLLALFLALQKEA